MSFMENFDYLKIHMKDIVSATNNFDPKRVIGRGGFGRVYKGEICSTEGQLTVAFKKLDRRLGQGNIEFWKEIMMLSGYKHENLISLKHFCVEGNDMILVYEYASRGSLDRYLSDASTLTWIQRLKICIGAVRGLCFLHDPTETHQRVLHRDIKSANILLDDNWTAKVSDFGLSKLGPANQAHTYIFSHGVGTPGYCDPLYMELGFLSKESDVYSFGVVLFEILCGRLCYEYSNGELSKILVPKWRQCYEEKRLDEIILPGLKEEMNPGSLESFSAIAYQCVNKAREERPTMAEIVKELELSLEQQVTTVVLKLGMHCEDCAQEIRKRILRMKGVESVEPDLKASQISVKGTFEAQQLVDYVRKLTRKAAVIVKQGPKANADCGAEKSERGGDTKVADLRKDDFKYYQLPPSRGIPGSQLFSDDNPNACTVM